MGFNMGELDCFALLVEICTLSVYYFRFTWLQMLQYFNPLN